MNPLFLSSSIGQRENPAEHGQHNYKSLIHLSE